MRLNSRDVTEEVKRRIVARWRLETCEGERYSMAECARFFNVSEAVVSDTLEQAGVRAPGRARKVSG